MRQRIFAVVYDPEHPNVQRLLGRLTCNGNPKVTDETKCADPFTTNVIMHPHESEKRFYVGVKHYEKEIIVGQSLESQEDFIFYVSDKTNQINIWSWKDGDDKVWLATEEFGRYLTYLLELPNE